MIFLLLLLHLNLPLSATFALNQGGFNTVTTNSRRSGRSPRSSISDLPTDSRRHSYSLSQVSTGGAHFSSLEDEQSIENARETKNSSTSYQGVKGLETLSMNETYNFWDDTLTVESFNMDLVNLAMESPQKAADALEIMEAMYHKDSNNDYNVRPNACCYTTVIEGWAGFQALPSSTMATVYGAEEDDESNQLHPQQCVSQNSYHHYGALQAQKWLDRLEAVYEATGDPQLKPNLISYMLVCQKWADDVHQDTTGESAERAEKILLKMKNGLVDPTVDPDLAKATETTTCSRNDYIKLWSIVLEAWCRRAGKVRRAIERAEELLTEMEVLSSQQQQQIGLNIITYTSFIAGLARSRERTCAQKAEKVLERMKSFGIEPDMVAYTAVLNCYSKTTSRKERGVAAKRALEILDFMEQQYSQEEKYHLKPNVITWGTAIKAIGNSLDNQSADLAQKVLRRMYSLHKTGTIASVKPQTSIFNAVISSFASHSRRTNGGQSHRRTANTRIPQTIGLQNARRAEQLLVEMIRRAREGETDVSPNVVTWGSVIAAWAGSGQPDAGEQAERVLTTMEELYDRGESEVRSNYVCYTSTVAAIGNSALPNNDPQFEARNIAAADKIEEMLMKMERDYEVSKDFDKRPNTITYITAFDAFCKLDDKNAATRARQTVDRIMRLYAKDLGYVRPSRIVFNSLINAWSRCPEKHLAPAQKAEEIFQWMEKQYKEAGDYIVRPDEVSLCGVLNAWANNAENGGARRAQQILDKIESMTAEERGFQLSKVCHNIVIKAWGRSREPDKHQQAERILLRLEGMWKVKQDEMLKPDVTTYSSVINCCAYYFSSGSSGDEEIVQEGSKEAFQVALRTFRKLCESSKPNNITFGTLLKAIANLSPVNEEREELIRSVFAQCCKEGQVDAFVLSQVRNASPPSLYGELVLEPCGLLDNTVDYTKGIDVVLKNSPPHWRQKSH